MTVFKNTFRIINYYKKSLLIYAVVFVALMLALQSAQPTNVTKDIQNESGAVYISNDDDHPLALGLVDFVTSHSKAPKNPIKDSDLEDALFFGQISAVIQIGDTFSEDFLEQSDTGLVVKTLGDMHGSYIEGLVNQYLTTIRAYQSADIELSSETVTSIVASLQEKTEVNYVETSSNDLQARIATASYFVILNYPILAQIILSVGLIMTTFKEEMVSKRHLVSSLKPSSYTFQLLLGLTIIAVLIWGIFMVVGLIMDYQGIVSYGLPHALNALLFTLSITSFSYFVAVLVKNKSIVNTMATVVSLGASFLSGGFVPRELIADSVINVSKVFPSFWYIDNVYLISEQPFTAVWSSSAATSYWEHLLILVGFSVLFGVLSYVVRTYRSRKIA